MRTKLFIAFILLNSLLYAQRAKSVILIYLDGGPSQTDTFDPKPNSSRDYYGPYETALQTNVPEIQIGLKLHRLAKIADKYSLIRSMTHGSNAHETGHYTMTTGDMTKGTIVYPSYGSVINYMKRNEYRGILPPYVSLTSANSRFNEAGFLGNEYKSFDTKGVPEAKLFEVNGIVNRYTNQEKLRERLELLSDFEKQSHSSLKIDTLRNSNLKLIWGAGREVYNLENESDSLRQAYGMNRLGQSCLAACRLIEAGVTFVNVRTTGWDTHKKHFQYMNTKLEELDKALSTLIMDLEQRGLLDSTIILCGGEFGRTPKILWEAPWNGGRAHFGKVFSYLVAGGGFKGGQVVGKSNDLGDKIIERPVYPCDLIGSIYLLLGINPQGHLPHPTEGNVPILPSLNNKGQSNGLLYEIMDLESIER